MKKIALIVLCFVVAVCVIILTRIERHVPAQVSNSQLEQGKYLVEAVAICFECHSERDYSQPGWPIPPGRVGGGRVMLGEGTPNQLVAPNITPDKETGIGTWSDKEIAKAIGDGISPDGHLLNPEMPAAYFHSLCESDLQSIVLYLRSIPAVRHRLPKNPPYIERNFKRAVLMDSLAVGKRSPRLLRGEFLVRIGTCETCHTPVRKNQYIEGLGFGGGTPFQHGAERVASANLTPDATGISYYDENRFIEVMRTGRVSARRLFSAMPWFFYRNMTTEDLRNIFAYLQSIPPVSHRVDNTQPPTLCKLCGNQHGFGDRN